MNAQKKKRLTGSLLLLLLILAVSASAQKLPGVQEAGLRIPANGKIDGKTLEWDNKLQADNNHIQCTYSIANDDANLYLAVQATDQAIIRRIMNGSITLTINPSGDKKDKNGMSVTYPVFAPATRFRASFRPTVTPGMMVKSQTGSAAANLTPAQADSLMLLNNKSLGEKAKSIRTAGIKDLDTLISVYNEEGIKAAGSFDNKLAYTAEFLVPLKYLGLSLNNPVKFSYQVRINETAMSGMSITYKDGSSGAVSGATGSLNPNNISSISVGPNAQASQPATDLWGEYTLVKK